MKNNSIAPLNTAVQTSSVPTLQYMTASHHTVVLSLQVAELAGDLQASK
jgi:hypothetical protein